MDEYEPTNREKKLTPNKKTSFWCGCDKTIIRIWKKCPICGRRNGARKFKK